MSDEKDLMDLTVRELLEGYCMVYSPECGYNYGIISWDNAEKVAEEYDLEDQYSWAVDSLINDELEIEDKPPLDWDIIKWILEDNLGFKKKK